MLTKNAFASAGRSRTNRPNVGGKRKVHGHVGLTIRIEPSGIDTLDVVFERTLVSEGTYDFVIERDNDGLATNMFSVFREGASTINSSIQLGH